MICFSLTCSKGHGFDSWFQSGDAFDKVQQAGLVSCTECGDTQVKKSIMAPRIGKTGDITAPRKPASSEADLKELRKKIEANSENVGQNFAAEARKIHHGEAPERAIIGEARLGEAKSLIEEGIPVAPLPFMPTRKVN